MCLLQFDDDILFIFNSLRNEFNLDVDQEKRIIWLLWNQREKLVLNWKKCESLLSPFMAPHNYGDSDSVLNRVQVGKVSLFQRNF